MSWDPPVGLNEYLCSSKFCDSDNPDIKNTAKRITNETDNPNEASKKIFLYVRDEILFGLDNFDVTASETLDKGYGQCVNKANLQVALLRSINIPARYHKVIISRNSLRGVVPNIALNSIPERIWWHPYCETYLDGNWIACETLFDKRLYDTAIKQDIISINQIPSVDWDGVNDIVQVSYWILEDEGAHSILDDVFTRVQKETMPPKFIGNLFLRYSNRYTNNLREKRHN